MMKISFDTHENFQVLFLAVLSLVEAWIFDV